MYPVIRVAVTKHKGPVYISLNTGNFADITPEEYQFIPGKPVKFSTGDDLTIIALGTAVHDVIQAQAILGETCKADVFAVSSIRPLDWTDLAASIKKTGNVLTVEQHSTHGGIGSLVAEHIAENGLAAKLTRIGVPEGTYTKNWIAVENKIYFGLDAEGISKTIMTIESWRT